MTAKRSKKSLTLITPDEVEAFRATLPEYRQAETFRMLASWFDVVKAFAMADKFKVPARDVSVDRIKSWLDITYTDDKYVESEACAIDSRPLLFLMIEVNGNQHAGLMIDGAHRLARAVKDGRETIQVILLDAKLSKECRMR